MQTDVGGEKNCGRFRNIREKLNVYVNNDMGKTFLLRSHTLNVDTRGRARIVLTLDINKHSFF